VLRDSLDVGVDHRIGDDPVQRLDRGSRSNRTATRFEHRVRDVASGPSQWHPVQRGIPRDGFGGRPQPFEASALMVVGGEDQDALLADQSLAQPRLQAGPAGARSEGQLDELGTLVPVSKDSGDPARLAAAHDPLLEAAKRCLALGEGLGQAEADDAPAYHRDALLGRAVEGEGHSVFNRRGRASTTMPPGRGRASSPLPR
jgi:hypothetical protein